MGKAVTLPRDPLVCAQALAHFADPSIAQLVVAEVQLRQGWVVLLQILERLVERAELCAHGGVSRGKRMGASAASEGQQRAATTMAAGETCQSCTAGADSGMW